MAILPNRPGLEVNVLVQGQKLVEHRDEHEEGEATDRVVRYIEAVSGAEFSVQLELKQDVASPKQQFNFKVDFFVDGLDIDRRCFLDHNFEYIDRYRVAKHILEGGYQIINGVTNKRRPKFADIKTDDRTRRLKSALLERAKNIGEVRLEFTKGAWKSSGIPSTYSSPIKDPLKEVSEKAFKGRAVSHQAAYGPPIPVTPPHICEQISTEPKPFAIFVFRYKSRDALQAEGIIPRSPSPIPLEERPVESLSAAEAQELIRRQKDALAKVKLEKTLKRERVSQARARYASSDTEDGVEEIERPAKFRKVVETVDLSGE